MDHLKLGRSPTTILHGSAQTIDAAMAIVSRPVSHGCWGYVELGSDIVAGEAVRQQENGATTITEVRVGRLGGRFQQLTASDLGQLEQAGARYTRDCTALPNSARYLLLST